MNELSNIIYRLWSKFLKSKISCFEKTPVFIAKNGFATIIMLLSYELFAQNLVPNSGFDTFTDCPSDIGQIMLAAPWVSASNGTPDLYNECSNEILMTVPNAGRYLDSYQVPRSGKGYAHIGIYNNNNVASGSNGNSEYIEVQLLQPMQKGKQYYLEFHVSPDFHAGYTNAIGLALSDTFYFETVSAMESLSLNPIIENKEIIKDTVNWTKISGCHIANGGERYAIIGNYNNTNETIVEFESPTFPFLNFFYIDDVLITLFDPLPDTLLLCDGISKRLNAGFLDATYLWNTGGTDSVITVSKAGYYTVEAYMQNCILRDTVFVLDTEKAINFPADTTICKDEPLQLFSPLPGKYLWSEGSQENKITVSEFGNYAVSVTNECGEFVYSTYVEIVDCLCNLYTPNAFSPNGDGINDFLELYFGCDLDYQLKRFSVFNRWGHQVYSVGQDENIKWDGSFSGKPLQIGVYIWFLEYDVMRNGVSQQKLESGNITILK